MAREHNLDLSVIPITGKHGHLTKDDVLNFLEGKTLTIPPPPPPPATPKIITPPSTSKVSTPSTKGTTTPTTPSTSAPKIPSVKPTTTTTPSASVTKPLQVLESDKVVSISGLQRIMVQTMTASNAVPQFGYSDEFHMDELVKVRNQVKKIAEQQGVRLSYLAFIIKATSLALIQYPQLNAWVKDADCTEIIYKASHNIGLAMDTPRGLLVPNIKNVQDKSVLDIGRELNRLADLGQQGKLGKDDLGGGTFTISNIGSIGGTYTKPIILLPEVMIGGLGKFQTLPRYDSRGQLYPATLMAVTWSADHRVLDGATVARFSNLLKQYIENPSSIIISTK
jgi:2-oxoisovalerate dehydrogenase E2 component (dihydrolipoyl transacylase)